MKFINTSLLILFLCIKIQAQVDSEKNGYIGVSIGSSYLLNGTYKDGRLGANISLVNLGYSFRNKLGITLKWMGAAHAITDDFEVGYGAVMIGPMYSLKISKNFLLDVKVQGGLFWEKEELRFVAIDNPDPNLPNASGKFRTTSLNGFSAGLNLRHNFARRWNWMLLAEYNTSAAVGFLTKNERINTISTNLGIGFRI